MDNPYRHHAANLENSASKIIVITPSDALPIAQVCKALRIYNPNAEPATISIVTSGGSEVTLTIPAACLWTEPAIVTHVKATGTTAELIIQGFTDMGTEPVITIPTKPVWLHSDALYGINFMTGEAWLNDALVTDLTTILDFIDPARLGPNGYDQRDVLGVVNGTRAKGNLMAELQAMNWAYRAEVSLEAGAIDQYAIMGAWNEVDIGGYDCFVQSTGEVCSTDYNGNYDTVGNFTAGQINVIASSNNAEGWLTSTNGAEALLDPTQTTIIPDQFNIGSINEGPMDTLNGYFRKLEFFPLRDAAQLQTLSAV